MRGVTVTDQANAGLREGGKAKYLYHTVKTQWNFSDLVTKF